MAKLGETGNEKGRNCLSRQSFKVLIIITEQEYFHPWGFIFFFFGKNPPKKKSLYLASSLHIGTNKCVLGIQKRATVCAGEW